MKWRGRERDREMGVGNVAAAATTTVSMHLVESSASKTMELKWVRAPKSQNYIDRLGMLSKTKPPPLSQASVPIFISTKASHVNPDELAQLYSSCNFSCHRFPKYVDSDSGTQVVELVDVHKLRVALSHSSVLVSVFCKPDDAVADSSSSMGLGDFFERLVMPVGPNNGQLVGFGRAVSDIGLTASIYDVMVIPSLRRLGIGRIIVRRIIRMLTSRDIYDIAAICSEPERPFFEACGFGNDILGSTAMMYTRTVSTDSEGNQMAKHAGRKLLLVPPIKKTFHDSKHLRL